MAIVNVYYFRSILDLFGMTPSQLEQKTAERDSHHPAFKISGGLVFSFFFGGGE